MGDLELQHQCDFEDYLRGGDIRLELSISKKTLSLMTEVLSKAEIENGSLKLEENRGFKLIAVEEINRRLRYLRKFYDEYLIVQKKRRELALDVLLIEESKKTVDILGINALGPLHSGREKLISFLKNGGTVRILLLNHSSEQFKNRQKYEENHNDLITGRLDSEYGASIAICKDIINFNDFKENFQIKCHDKAPKMALVISDGNEEYGIMNCNIYPLEPNTRGVMGRHKLNIKKQEVKSHFEEYLDYFNSLWMNGKSIEEIDIFIKTYRNIFKK